MGWDMHFDRVEFDFAQSQTHTKNERLLCEVTSEMSPEQILYTRAESGGYPVKVTTVDGGRLYTLERPEGQQVFPSARKLLIAITGNDRHWTFERYFRTGRFSQGPQEPHPILDIFGPDGWGVSPSGAGRRSLPGKKKPSGRVYPTQTTMGIDLVARGREVAKLLFAGFSGMIRAGGYDPDDVLQEVYQGILVRNAGSCPFNPAKASFGHYVHMVCRCVLANYHRRHQRHAVEQLGLPGYGEDTLDVGDDRAIHPVVPSFDLSDRIVLSDVARSIRPHPQRQLAIKVLPLLREGRSRDEISEALGENKTNVGRAMLLLREQLRG